jgi:hypothetical protein
VPRIDVAPPNAIKILQTPPVTALLYDLDTGPTFRQVHTDGRPLPDNPEPTWLGYSIGHWDGDVLVVESAGFRDGGWIDTQRARPHSDALRVTERLRRLNVGRMEMTITIDDPKAFVKPWTVRVPFRLIADSELLEGSCEGHVKTPGTSADRPGAAGTAERSLAALNRVKAGPAEARTLRAAGLAAACARSELWRPSKPDTT